jgi:hypothetical protein
METFIMIVMLCHLDFIGQEGCIPMTPNPQVYYSSKKECMNASIQKMEDMKVVAIYNNITVTQTYATCIKEGFFYMTNCIYRVYKGFCLLLKDCKCQKKICEDIYNLNPFKFSL